MNLSKITSKITSLVDMSSTGVNLNGSESIVSCLKKLEVSSSFSDISPSESTK